MSEPAPTVRWIKDQDAVDPGDAALQESIANIAEDGQELVGSIPGHAVE